LAYWSCFKIDYGCVGGPWNDGFPMNLSFEIDYLMSGYSFWTLSGWFLKLFYQGIRHFQLIFV